MSFSISLLTILSLVLKALKILQVKYSPGIKNKIPAMKYTATILEYISSIAFTVAAIKSIIPPTNNKNAIKAAFLGTSLLLITK